MTAPTQIQLPTIFPMQTVNSWLFRDPVPTLIDCGEDTDAVWQAIEKGLLEAGLQITDLERIVITHAHVDHMGMAGRLATEASAEVWVSDYVYDWAFNKDGMWKQRADLIHNLLLKHQTGSDAEQNFIQYMSGFTDKPLNIWSQIPKERIRRFSITDTLELGSHSWQPIYAPGHCINQTVFYQPESRQLLGADLLLKVTATPVIEPELGDASKRSKGLQQILESYRMIKEMDISVVLPGHYAPIHNPNELIDSQIKRIHQRKMQCFELIQSGKNSLWDLFTGMYHPNLSMPGLSMLVGYLDLLLAEERISFDPAGEPFLYYPAAG